MWSGDSHVMVKVTGWDNRSSSIVLHVNWAFASSFLAEYSRTEEVVDSPVTGSTSTEAEMEIPTQETNDVQKKTPLWKPQTGKITGAILAN